VLEWDGPPVLYIAKQELFSPPVQMGSGAHPSSGPEDKWPDREEDLSCPSGVEIWNVDGVLLPHTLYSFLEWCLHSGAHVASSALIYWAHSGTGNSIIIVVKTYWSVA
jgi:hypothetical protein